MHGTHMMRSLITLAVAASLWSLPVRGQSPVEQPRTEFGLLGGVSFNIHKADFTQLGNYASCCPEFTTGTGIGAQFGGFLTLPLAADWRMMARLTYANQSGSFISSEESFVADLRDTARVVPAVFTHELDASLSSVSLEPLLAYRAVTGLDVMAGVRFGLVTQHAFLQQETLTEPEDYGSYLGTDRTWVNHDAEIPEAQSTRFTAVVGARYVIPLTRSRSLFMAPEVFYHLPLTDVAGAVDWRVSEIRFGIEIGWAPAPAPEPKVEPIPVAPIKPRTPPTTLASLWVEAIGPDGSVVDLDSIRIEETRVLDLLPVLGHVYFDDGSAELPSRYVNGARVPVAEMATFDQAMHGVLAIVADRLRSTSSRVTLVGATSNTSRDKGLPLARSRALAVRNALVSLGVSADRIRIEARQLPAMPTRSSNADDAILAEQENRRVDIVPADPDVLLPITLASVRRTIRPEQAIARTAVISYPGVVSADLHVATPSHQSRASSTDGTMELALAVPQFLRERPSPLTSTLTVVDSLGATTVERDTVPISYLTVERKRAERRADTEIERYSLILFAFDDANVTADHARVLDRVRERIREGASVKIFGMTDSMGSSEYNRELSRRRALSVARALGLDATSIEALGSASPRFANASPEGRAYNRTVVIEITTNVR